MLLNLLKKRPKLIVFSTITALFVTIFSVPSLRAASSDDSTQLDSTQLLELIRVYISTILHRVNLLPTYLHRQGELVEAFLLPDTSDSSANLQNDFTELTNLNTQSKDNQENLQNQLLAEYYAAQSASIKDDVPYINDISYSTLLNKPFLSSSSMSNNSSQLIQLAAYHYLKNASGLALTHTLPSKDWPSGTNRDNYFHYYVTLMTIQTFNSYVLSSLYTDFNNQTSDGKTLNNIRDDLKQQANSSDWFTTVASEKIGDVLRQMLMYNSQIYTLLLEQKDIQKKMLATQAMTNTLLIIANQFTESNLLAKANPSSTTS